MDPSEELKIATNQFFEYLNSGKLRKLASFYARDEGIVVVGTDPKELWYGSDVHHLAGIKGGETRFEHYPRMAEKKLAEIRERAIVEFGLIDATIIHRVGTLPIGENIVLIVTAAEHRDEAFQACRFYIDELKRITPIWKKETTPDGVVWVEAHP